MTRPGNLSTNQNAGGALVARPAGQALAIMSQTWYTLSFPPRATTRAEGRMKKAEKVVSWVVYLMTVHGKPSGMNAVCEASEWEAMERAQPGYHTLVKAGIPSESE